MLGLLPPVHPALLQMEHFALFEGELYIRMGRAGKAALWQQALPRAVLAECLNSVPNLNRRGYHAHDVTAHHIEHRHSRSGEEIIGGLGVMGVVPEGGRGVVDDRAVGDDGGGIRHHVPPIEHPREDDHDHEPDKPAAIDHGSSKMSARCTNPAAGLLSSSLDNFNALKSTKQDAAKPTTPTKSH